MKRYYVTKMSCGEVPFYKGRVIEANTKKEAIEIGRETLPQIGTGKTRCVFYAEIWK